MIGPHRLLGFQGRLGALLIVVAGGEQEGFMVGIEELEELTGHLAVNHQGRRLLTAILALAGRGMLRHLWVLLGWHKWEEDSRSR